MRLDPIEEFLPRTPTSGHPPWETAQFPVIGNYPDMSRAEMIAQISASRSSHSELAIVRDYITAATVLALASIARAVLAVVFAAAMAARYLRDRLKDTK